MENIILSSYKIGKTIGRGTFGKVKKGVHKITQQPVAIKILEKSKIKDVTDVERVSRQLHILKIVRHSAIAQLYQIIQTADTIFIVMEYAEGGQFFDYIMDGRIENQNHAYYYFSQLVDALQYLHKNKIAHRDVKPENILLDTHQKLKMVDFGLSNMYKKDQLLNTACGSPCYASPQMIKGQQYHPQFTDVWSLGIVLYTTIFAKLPFQDDNTTILYNKIKSGVYLLQQKVSSQLKDLLSKMLNVKPNKRISLQGIRQHPWCKSKQAGPTHGIMIGYQKIPIDHTIIRQILQNQLRKQVKPKEFEIKQFDRNFDRLKRQIQNNVKNPMTATYYLLLKKNFKLGRGSSSDICSIKFNAQKLRPSFQQQKKLKIIRPKSLDLGAMPKYYQGPLQKQHQIKSKILQLAKSQDKQPRVFYFSLQKQKKVQKDSYQDRFKKHKTSKKFDFIYPRNVIDKVLIKSHQSQQFCDFNMKLGKQRVNNQQIYIIKNQSDCKKRVNIQNFIETRKRLKTDQNKQQSLLPGYCNKKPIQKMSQQIFKIYIPKDHTNCKDKKGRNSVQKHKNVRVRSKQKSVSRDRSKQKGKTQQIDITGVFWKKKKPMQKGHTTNVTKQRNRTNKAW